MKTFEEFYLKKDYTSALKTLETNQKNIDPAIWNYNMGLTLAELSNWPLARYHFLLAEDRGLESKSLSQNKKWVESKLELERLEKPIDLSDYMIKAGLIAVNGPLISLSLIFLIAGLILLKKSKQIKATSVMLVFMALSLGLNYWIGSWPRKIVIEKKSLYEGPSVLFSIKGNLPPGVMVLTRSRGDWEEIIFPSRFSGWIKPDGFKNLETK